MGDRTNCRLTVFGGPLSPEDSHTLSLALEKAWPSEIEDDSLRFEDVNYGEIYTDLKTSLTDLGLSFSWSWEPGGTYDAGILLYNAETKASEEFATSDGDFVFTLDEIDTKPERIQAGRDWWKWLQDAEPMTLPPIQKGQPF